MFINQFNIRGTVCLLSSICQMNSISTCFFCLLNSMFVEQYISNLTYQDNKTHWNSIKTLKLRFGRLLLLQDNKTHGSTFVRLNVLLSNQIKTKFLLLCMISRNWLKQILNIFPSLDVRLVLIRFSVLSRTESNLH